MSRRIALCAIALVASIGFSHAGGLTLAHPYPEGSAVDQWARELSACLDSRSGMFVDVIGGAKLGRSDDIADAIRAGYVDMAIVPARSLGRQWPALSRLGQSEPIPDPAQMMRLSQSTGFLERINQIGAKRFELVVLSVGWQFSALVGKDGRLEDGALRAARFFVPGPSKGEERGDFLQEMIRRVGAEPAPLDARDIDSALRYHAFDGGVVDVEMARRAMSQRGFDQLQWSQDHAAFASPVIVLMSANSYASKEILSRFERLFSGPDGCLATTTRFNQRSVAEMQNLVDEARQAGIRVTPVSAVWRDAYRETIALLRSPDDELIAKAVGKELSQ